VSENNINDLWIFHLLKTSCHLKTRSGGARPHLAQNPKLNNIHPIDNHLISREEKETRLGQHAKVFWFTGFSGSGKRSPFRER